MVPIKAVAVKITQDSLPGKYQTSGEAFVSAQINLVGLERVDSLAKSMTTIGSRNKY